MFKCLPREMRSIIHWGSIIQMFNCLTTPISLKRPLVPKRKSNLRPSGRLSDMGEFITPRTCSHPASEFSSC
ncbi:MAG: hypothetical protein COX07_07610 [Bacteroidetes bacterium CG23_combo_of_CG06-09_8_20_14_all_32_9]|nr:MAG: hypothetical protein COX07_07610 [Bacteroidetes bacterium CG23_combo_of_CG06-09_8_20_14_all_32_9]